MTEPPSCRLGSGALALENGMTRRGIAPPIDTPSRQSRNTAATRHERAQDRGEQQTSSRSGGANVRRPFLFLVFVTMVLATQTAPGAASGRHHHLWVEIRRTEFGTPHILAHDYESLGYGYGYAFAQDDICTIANDYVTGDARRSRYFG